MEQGRPSNVANVPLTRAGKRGVRGGRRNKGTMELKDGMDGLPGLALLVVPWLVLAAMAWRSRRFPISGRAPPRDAPWPDASEASHALDALPGTAPLTMISRPDATFCLEEREAPEGGAALLHLEPQDSGDLDAEERLVTALGVAEANGDAAGRTQSGLELARLMLARGARPQAEALLRKTVIVATSAKLPIAHAQARIELADLASSDGDMTTACEHWQMAKLLFHELDRRKDRELMADLMRDNGCPTDWFLTGF